MSISRYYWRLCGWLTAAFTIGLVLGFVGRDREIPTERLGWQAGILTKISQDAMQYRATPKRVAEKVEKELNTKVEWEVTEEDDRGNPQKIGVVVLPAETGFGGMGGRWILALKLAKDGHCDQVWMEMQPQGFM